MGNNLLELGPQRAPIALAFVGILRRVGLQVTPTSVGRDTAKQVQLWRRCMSGQSRFPAAYPGSSPHEKHIAFDLHISPEGPLVVVNGRKIGRAYAIAGMLWERLGFRWGGRFRDEIHFDFYRTGQNPPGDPRSCRP